MNAVQAIYRVLNNVQGLTLVAHPPLRPARTAQRAKLIACAEAVIAADGIAGLKARRIADGVGCSLGAIYNLVADLDELVLLVSQRTMADLNGHLDAVAARRPGDVDTLVAWALAYAGFAAEHRNRWRALFEHRLPPGRDLPGWFAEDQMRLFVRLEEALAALTPSLDVATRRLRARTLFSAVHGIVVLGLEEKLAAMPVGAVEAELAGFVRAYVAGMGR